MLGAPTELLPIELDSGALTEPVRDEPVLDVGGPVGKGDAPSAVEFIDRGVVLIGVGMFADGGVLDAVVFAEVETEPNAVVCVELELKSDADAACVPVREVAASEADVALVGGIEEISVD